jgi:hypothetical protein
VALQLKGIFSHKNGITNFILNNKVLTQYKYEMLLPKMGTEEVKVFKKKIKTMCLSKHHAMKTNWEQRYSSMSS